MNAARTALVLVLTHVTLAGCKTDDDATTVVTVADGAASGAPGASAPQPWPGMVWIPAGALVAGTPLERLPRVADAEMLGEQVVLSGYYVDQYPFPNEEGAIPQTSVSAPEAAALCAERGKRLCTELEWERACKGPDNHVYEYGDEYRADRCGTGHAPQLRPVGLRVGCRSDFGVRDLHGAVLEWTSSPWGRGGDGDLVAVRGGNGAAGELWGRCANVVRRGPGERADSLGFRCCAGTANAAEVTLVVEEKRPALVAETSVARELGKKLLSALGPSARKDLGKLDRFVFDRSWRWRPIGNEELRLIGGCTGLGYAPACGVLIGRETRVGVTLLGWAPSARFAPTVNIDREPTEVWLLGGDEKGTFRTLIQYSWGRVEVGTRERRVPTPSKKKKKR